VPATIAPAPGFRRDNRWVDAFDGARIVEPVRRGQPIRCPGNALARAARMRLPRPIPMNVSIESGPSPAKDGLHRGVLRAVLAVWMTMPVLSIAGLGAGPKDGFKPLFNGHDLKGWVNVNCAPETWSVKDGTIHCTGLPTGALRTVRQYENFVLELDWRHLSTGGNSGIFIWASPVAAPGVPFLRAIEVQVLDHGYNYPGKNEWYTTHGDVFPIHGSSMKPFGKHNGMRSFPSSEHGKGSPEWNHYRIVATNGVLRLSVNGFEVSGGGECNFRKGYIGLESEGAPVEFRDIRLLELAPGAATPAVSAPLDPTWRNLFTGLDFRAWKTNGPASAHWTVGGERLHASGPPASDPARTNSVLWTDRSYRDAEWMFDANVAKPAEGQPVPQPVAWIRGAGGKGTEVRLPAATPGRHQRYSVKTLGRAVTIFRDGVPLEQWTLPLDAPKGGEFGLSATGGKVEFMNVYVRDVR